MQYSLLLAVNLHFLINAESIHIRTLALYLSYSLSCDWFNDAATEDCITFGFSLSLKLLYIFIYALSHCCQAICIFWLMLNILVPKSWLHLFLFCSYIWSYESAPKTEEWTRQKSGQCAKWDILASLALCSYNV